MTPREFAWHLDAHARRERREWERAAFVVQNALAPWMGEGKKAPTIEQLIGPNPFARPGDTPATDAAAERVERARARVKAMSERMKQREHDHPQPSPNGAPA